MMDKFRKLKANEIDVRISQITQYSVTLLLYKDARVDMNILDETVGMMNWRKEYSRNNANCTVSIWDENKKQWVAKEDTGKESFTEKEKGLASDSFKRACFNWGIGRELYTAPRIRCKASLFNIKDGKCYDRFVVTDIDYDDDGSIARLKILNEDTNVIIFDMGKEEKPQSNFTDQVVEQKHVTSLMKKCRDDGVDFQKICAKYGVKTLNALTMSQLSEIVKNWTAVIVKECGV